MQPFSFLEHFKDNPVVQRLFQALKHERYFEVTDTFRELTILLIALIQKENNRPMLIVTHNLFHAQKLFDRLKHINQGAYLFPQDEFLTTDMLAMSEDLKYQRLTTIKAILDDKSDIIITNPSGYLKQLWPLQQYKNTYLRYQVGDDIDSEAFKQRLIQLGYEAVPNVEKIGDFAVRGSIIDIFLADETQPIRIDLFDTEIDSLRYFDIKSQRSTKKIKAFNLFPRTEFFYDKKTVLAIEKKSQDIIENEHLNETSQTRIFDELEQLKQYQNQDQLARYMSFSGEKLETMSDYMNDPFILFIESEKIKTAYRQLLLDLDDWMSENGDYPKIGFDFLKDINRVYYRHKIAFNTFKSKEKIPFSMPLRAKESMSYEGNIHMLIKDLKKYEGYVTVLITLQSDERIERLIQTLEEHLNVKRLGKDDAPFKKAVNIQQSSNPLSVEWFDAEFILLNDEKIFGTKEKKAKRKQPKIFKESEAIKSLDTLKKGDYIVHYDYGIGRFLGIETKTIGKHINDYIVIAYKGDDKLYIPVENIHLIQRYASHEGMRPRLNKIGSPEWAKTKRRVRKKAKDIAENLIKLYAARENSEGYAFSKDDNLYLDFEADFPYEETADQSAAIEAVKNDMEKAMPMDRLVCGDVGYGKTEVAMRAAFKAVLDNKQVVYLAPTTILTRQHYYTFKERMEKHGIRIALLNRFVKKQRQQAFIKDIEAGKIDVIIGTHRLLSKDVKFRDLGLLIIDEEQRFGVEHKEKIKQMKLQIDVLSLSATPIPRTLQMAMSGVKQMSLIETPPKNRFPIQTYVLRQNDHVIADAIERELGRNGQVFYLYNHVEDIAKIKDKLDRLVPDARIAYGHGQMSRIQLENVMRDFLDHKFDVLVSTTIIETGLDIPNANTLIIHESDKLGLAQLYQIRGRVGRSDRIAYSYLMYEKHKQLTDEASKRLQAIKEFTELGSGFKIASRDLAIRGAGDLLGTEQSGTIDAVGIDLFMEILKEEIEKGTQTIEHVSKETTLKQGIKMPASKTIPKSYIDDDDMRIEMHKRIAKLANSKALQQLKTEFKDRFGKVPPEINAYMLEKCYENLAIQVGVEKVRKSKTTTTLILDKEASKHIHGEMLFDKANQLSKHIFLSYKHDQLHMAIEHHKVNKHILHLVIPLLETLI